MTRKRAKRNPSTEIPSDWNADLWQWAPKPTHAHWTSYPTYAYQQFYRANPRPKKARRNEGEMADKLPSWVRAPRIVSEVDVPVSSAEARPVPWAYAQNAGPFLPQMFPYGQGGRPYVYANPREDVAMVCESCGTELEDGELDICRFCEEVEMADEAEALDNPGSHGGFLPAERARLPAWYFLKQKGRGWPAGDPRRDARDDFHALQVIHYMDRGFGNRSEYPKLIVELAKRYPVSSKRNKVIWDVYRREYDSIAAKCWKHLPTVAELRKLGK